MERLIITIRPDKSDDAPLGAEDALRQVVDLLRLHKEAARAVAFPEEPFKWVLESATTNSPFTLTARAEALFQGRDADPYVRAVTREWAAGITDFGRGVAPTWADPDSLAIAGEVFRRNRNGIGATEIKPDGSGPIVIDRSRAEKALEVVRTTDPLSEDPTAGEGQSWGQLRGRMYMATQYRKKPAIKVSSAQYGTVWVILKPHVAKVVGDATKLKEMWENQSVIVEGRFIYAAGGQLKRIVADDVHPIDDAPPIELSALRELDLTSGLDPVEYLRRLHEGDLG